jgi:hypothetical protein
MKLILAVFLVVSTLTAAETNAGMSSEFKKKAWKALDAIGRINPIVSKENADETEQQKILDAQKAVDDAKYEASNADDKHYADVLFWAVSRRADMPNWYTGDSQWEKDIDRAVQCELEVRVQVTPEDLRPEARDRAAKATCVKSEVWEAR